MRVDWFFNKVDKTESCWVWKGATLNGYGKFLVNKKHVYSHKISYQLFKGEIPKGKELDHLCRNILCVNPEHLEAVTHRENVLRGIGPTAMNSKKTHCQRGHSYNEKNTFYYKDGRRWCKICKIERQRITQPLYRKKLKTLITTNKSDKQ